MLMEYFLQLDNADVTFPQAVTTDAAKVNSMLCLVSLFSFERLKTV